MCVCPELDGHLKKKKTPLGCDVYSRVVETFGRGSCDQLCPLLLSGRNVHVNPFILKKRESEVQKQDGRKKRNWERESKRERERETDLEPNILSIGLVLRFRRTGRERLRQTVCKGWRELFKNVKEVVWKKHIILPASQRNKGKTGLWQSLKSEIEPRSNLSNEKGSFFARKPGTDCSEIVKERGVVMMNIQVWGTETLHTTDWLMCMCRADMGNVIVAFISCNGLPSYSKKAIQGHFVLLTMRVAVTCQPACERLLPTVHALALICRCREGISCQAFSLLWPAHAVMWQRSQWPAGSVMYLNNWTERKRQRGGKKSNPSSLRHFP